MITSGIVTALSKNAKHNPSKEPVDHLQLLEGLGVAGDAHAGVTVKHRSRVAKDPTQPNLRQIHLIHAELHDELAAAGFHIVAGQMGENITTRGIDLLGLPRGAQLRIGSTLIEVTGLRNPCHQLNSLEDGLLDAVLDRDEAGNLVRKAGIMGVVLQGGEIVIGDEVQVELPNAPFEALAPV